jgi:hypothetical protein
MLFLINEIRILRVMLKVGCSGGKKQKGRRCINTESDCEVQEYACIV